MCAEDAGVQAALHEERAMADVADSERSRIRFDCETAALDLGVHKYQLLLRVHQAHEGQQEVILLALLRWYNDRREDSWVCWEEGHMKVGMQAARKGLNSWKYYGQQVLRRFMRWAVGHDGC